jgi:O-antigen ligase
MGLVGLASFLLVIAVLFFEAARAWRRLEPGLEPVWYGLHAALVGALVGGLADHYFFNLDFHHSVAFFWLYVGLAIVSSRLALADA